MSISGEMMDRIKRIAGSEQVAMVAVGPAPLEQRGISYASENWPGLRSIAVKTLGAVVIAAGLHASPSEASGLGVDPNVYGQANGQVMQAGNAIQADVLAVRPVMIELQAEPTRPNYAVTYGIPAGSAALGGLLGHKIGGKSSSGQQAGTIIGSLAGGLAGVAVADAMNKPNEARQIPGFEITVRNPVTRNVAVVTQAGDTQFAPGDKVLVVSMGNGVRVVPDPSRQKTQTQAVTQFQDQGFENSAVASHEQRQSDTAREIIRTANVLGLRIDLMKVAALVEPGPVPNQSFGGKVVAVDPELKLVYQELGRGDGTVHSFSKLSQIPRVGEYVQIQYRDGQGLVSTKSRTQPSRER